MSAYPSAAVEVVDFHYENDLWLTRKIEAVQRRTREDANYVVGASYETTLTVTGAGAPKEQHVEDRGARGYVHRP